MTTRRRDRRRAERKSPSPPDGAEPGEGLTFTKWTALFGGAGIVTAAAGFYLLSQGSIALAPVLLLVAFLGLFPLALVR